MCDLSHRALNMSVSEMPAELSNFESRIQSGLLNSSEVLPCPLQAWTFEQGLPDEPSSGGRTLYCNLALYQVFSLRRCPLPDQKRCSQLMHLVCLRNPRSQLVSAPRSDLVWLTEVNSLLSNYTWELAAYTSQDVSRLSQAARPQVFPVGIFS